MFCFNGSGMFERGPGDEWMQLADVVLQRAALVARLARDRAPDPLAGLKVDEDDLAALLGEIPGLEEASARADEVEEATASEVALAEKRFAESLAGDGRFAELARRAGLGEGDAVVLSVLCAVEADPRRQRIVGYLNDDITARRPTLWTLSQVLDPAAALAALSPAGALRRACLLDKVGDGPWSSGALGVAAPVMWWLSGVESPDPELPAGCRWVPGESADGAAMAGGRAGGAAVAGGDRSARGRIAVASGPDRVRRLQALARSLDASSLLVLPYPPDEAAAWNASVRAATLAGAAVVVELDQDLPATARDRLESAGHLRFGLSSRSDLPLGSLPTGWVGAAVEDSLATDLEWSRAFGPEVVPTLTLTAEQVELAAQAAAAVGGSVEDAVRRLAAGHIDTAARRIRPSRTWEDLVLDADREELVRTVAVRCRQRRTVYDRWGFSPSPSKGVVALFAGPSGTGKTLAAEVIAGDLGVDLYAVDLANLVSKYIGETEKNLSRIFDAAEAAGVALFFDEADALLGKRSAVSDAHDRYANIEVAYLLQRLERYEGLAVMATNLVNNLDPAFVRRLHVVVEFPMPGPAERERIWRRSLPASAPLAEDLDPKALADRFEIAGGTIRNAALSAGFLAAEAGTSITMAVALKGVQLELRKIGRLILE